MDQQSTDTTGQSAALKQSDAGAAASGIGAEQFGREKVGPGEKQARVRGVFDSVADRYDLMNDLMSVGIHRAWRKVLFDRLAPRPGQTLIDMAGGTGDLAETFLARADEWAGLHPERAQSLGPAQVYLCDINFEMLKAGTDRPDAERFASQITRLCVNAEAVPLPDRSADVYTIGFGIRNVTHRDRALREAYRLLKPGGRFVCLEFSHMITASLQRLYDLYSYTVIPRLGDMITGDGPAYDYLVESIRRFPTQDAFAHEIEMAGFSRVGYENLSGGIAALHTGWRL